MSKAADETGLCLLKEASYAMAFTVPFFANAKGAV